MRRLRSYGTLGGVEWRLDTDVLEQPVGLIVSRSSSPSRLEVPKRRYRLTSQNSERPLPPSVRQVQVKHYRTDTILILGLIFFLEFGAPPI
jgi:hypothetical protein